MSTRAELDIDIVRAAIRLYTRYRFDARKGDKTVEQRDAEIDSLTGKIRAEEHKLEILKHRHPEYFI